MKSKLFLIAAALMFYVVSIYPHHSLGATYQADVEIKLEGAIRIPSFISKLPTLPEPSSGGPSSGQALRLLPARAWKAAPLSSAITSFSPQGLHGLQAKPVR